MYFQSNHQEDCCGCGLCSRTCPQNAITMQPDSCGFSYPSIDPSRCVKCGLCEKVCIVTKKPLKTGFETRFLAVCNKDIEVVSQSSSGGMFTLMAEEIFRQGGAVYGVAYSEDFRVEHQKAESMETAKGFRTSKYVQSDNAILFDSVRQDLLQKKPVLVTGTPCQIASLNAYLTHSHTDTKSLITCDNICHGVSSPLTFRDYLSSLKRYIPAGDRISYLNMRHKQKTGSKTTLEIHTEKLGKLPQVDAFSYYRLFLNRIANRPSCFACPFTSYDRVGDLSVADFWNGKDKDFAFDTSHGVNEVLINSPKGAAFFATLSEHANFQEVSREKAWQPHLEYPTQKPASYEAFWEEYQANQDKELVMRKYLKVSPLFKVINFAIPILRKTGLYSFFGKLYQTIYVKKSKES